MINAENVIFQAVECRVDTRGRITLPLALRRHLGLFAGMSLMFTTASNGKIVVDVVRNAAPILRETQLALSQGTHPLPPAISLSTTADMVEQGKLVLAVEFQRLMGWSNRRAVQHALAAGRVFALTLGSEIYFPAFFADAAYERRHLEAVTRRLGSMPAGAKLQFFLTRKGSLGGTTVLQALAAGHLEKVLRTATAFAED